MSEIAVLVVGAGPTGLTLACELARRGVPFRIIDKAPSHTQLSKAIAVHARTLELLEAAGVTPELLSRGVLLHGTNVFADGRKLVSLSFDELDSRYPYILALPQAETEQVLEQRLGELGVSVERSTEFLSAQQVSAGVLARVRGPDGAEQQIEAEYLVGADGAHSSVRKGLSLEFEGASYAEQFILADVAVSGELAVDRVSAFFSQGGLMAAFPIPGSRFRLVGSYGDSADDCDRELSLDEVQRRFAESCHFGGEVSEPRWLARFRIHCRQVERYRVGRTFLAGDAAHIHSPLGGQGMNTGIQDAHNLAWKLATVHAGRAPASLLDSYHQERHAVGKGVLLSTDVATRVATLRHPVARAIRNRMASFMSSLEVIQQRIIAGAAEIDLGYRSSGIVEDASSNLLKARVGRDDGAEEPNLSAWRQFQLAPHAGDRAPDAVLEVKQAGSSVCQSLRLYELCKGLRHALLLFDGRAHTREGYERLGSVANFVERRFPGLIDSYIVLQSDEVPGALGWQGPLIIDREGELEERYGARSECVYLLRPDFYVGYRSQPADFESLQAYLDRNFVV